jgi:membrane protein DedA with SNARE-associated domain
MLLLLDGLQAFIEQYVGRFNYLGPFVVLLLCGLGLPIPEEATLITCGVLLHGGDVDFVSITLVCSSAILLGDSVPYWLGRHYGMRALQVGWVRRVLHPERFARFEARFAKHGDWATFFLRFLPGARIAGYFVVGTMRMSYLRFMAIDALGVLISVPTSIYAAKLAKQKLEELGGTDGGHWHLLVMIAGVVVLGLVIKLVRRKPQAPPAPDPTQEPGAPDAR